MLGKLFKHEFKNTSKIMLLIYGMFAVITLLGTLVLSNDAVRKGETTAANIMLAVLLISYMLSVFALFIVTYVYMCIHFYKSMYSHQGYLTHTLPVKPSTLFHVKLGTSLVWMVCTLALLFLSIFLFIIGASHGEIFSAEVSSELHRFAVEFEQELGMSMGTFFLHMCISILLSCLCFLLWVFTSASVGQLFSQYKVVAAIVTGVILYFVEQIASMIIMFTSGYINTLSDDTAMYSFSFVGVNAVSTAGESSTAGLGFLGNMLTATYIWSILLCVVYYIVCRIIVQKHLNLE